MRAEQGKVVVVNSSMPEMDYLAAGLHRRGMLRRYVRRYVNRDRWWEQVVAHLPLAGGGIGRRTCDAPLEGAEVRDAGRGLDFAAAMLRLGGLPAAPTLSRALLRARDAAIARAGEQMTGRHARAVAANFGVALPAFQRIKRQGGVAVLNDPIAHHRFCARLLEEEAEREPEFAATLESQRFPRELENRLEEECAAADCILVGSEFARRTFVAGGCEPWKVAVVPYGVDATNFHPGRAARKGRGTRFLFAGQITQRKGIAYLLRAFGAIRGRDTELLLVGSYAGQERVFRGYRGLFRWFAPVPRFRMPEIYRGADVFVFPTLLEGMGLVALEAMACGLPVITTACGPDQVVRDGTDGFVVPARDVDALAHAMERLHRNRELRRWMAGNAVGRAREFRWETYMSAVADRIDRTMSGRAQAAPYDEGAAVGAAREQDDRPA